AALGQFAHRVEQLPVERRLLPREHVHVGVLEVAEQLALDAPLQGREGALGHVGVVVGQPLQPVRLDQRRLRRLQRRPAAARPPTPGPAPPPPCPPRATTRRGRGGCGGGGEEGGVRRLLLSPPSSPLTPPCPRETQKITRYVPCVGGTGTGTAAAVPRPGRSN